MNGHPYTDEQVHRFHDAMETTTVGFDRGDVEFILRGLHGAGITVTFPEPRFWVHENYEGQWFVIRGGGTAAGDHVAYFEGPDAQRYAREHADRLNREMSS